MLDLGRPLCLGLSRRGYPRLRLQLCSSFPYDNSTAEEMELYLDTRDQLQTMVEDRPSYSAAPTIILGDFNTTLPEAVSW